MSLQAQDSKKETLEAKEKSSKSILVVTGLPDSNESEAMAYYSERAKKLFAEAGGKPISKYKVKEQLYGNHSAALVFIAEFPSDQAIKNFFNSKAYKAILPYRNKAFKSLNIYIVNQ
ncbi:hypothetical protein A9Q86_03235 [Flavobacteriales bacterium 33_180_T64]|nr:hypothetical protein A9Q86_03235 [Flavobacteriales bacterium 33_180_T64]